MTDPNYTAIALLVDRSGSMHVIQQSADDAINEFINTQRTAAVGEQRRTVRVSQFDHLYENVHKSLNAKDVPRFQLFPSGMTALHDAMAQSIREFGEELAALPEDERPSTVIYAVMTDGMENASVTHTREQVRKMVQHQEEVYKWQVLYLGANQDAIQVGFGLGVRQERSLTYSASNAGTSSVVNSLGDYVAVAAAGAPAGFTDEDREEAAKEDE
jgi:uncharacterized protein YegL